MTQPSSLFEPEPDPIVGEVADIVARYGYGPVLAEVQMHAPLRVVPSAPARRGDPETSHLASKDEPDLSRFSERSRQAKLLRIFAADPRTDQGATILLVGTNAAPSAFDGCRRRCSDLRAAGYLSDTGMRRKNMGSDDESIVWQVTIAGHAALENLDETGWSR